MLTEPNPSIRRQAGSSLLRLHEAWLYEVQPRCTSWHYFSTCLLWIWQLL